MKNKTLNIFKIEYHWVEDDHYETLLGKDIEREEFEKDLIKAKEFAESLFGKEVKHNYLGKGYSIQCLQEYYEQIIWYLATKLGYIRCYINENIKYEVSDDDGSKKIVLTKVEKQDKRDKLKTK